MIKLNFWQKNRAEHGTVISEEKQTLLSKRREKLQSKLSPARFYIELTLILMVFLSPLPHHNLIRINRERLPRTDMP
jgi:hypothetical protein